MKHLRSDDIIDGPYSTNMSTTVNMSLNGGTGCLSYTKMYHWTCQTPSYLEWPDLELSTGSVLIYVCTTPSVESDLGMLPEAF